jgi:hypothetical protein
VRLRRAKSDRRADERLALNERLPLTLPQPCPICGAQVVLTAVTGGEEADDGRSIVTQADYDCTTEPAIESPEWQTWFRGHFVMPYVDWLPWEIDVLEWLNERYVYTWRNAEAIE